MFALICVKCHTELQVPNNLAGCLIRCHECEAVTRRRSRTRKTPSPMRPIRFRPSRTRPKKPRKCWTSSRLPRTGPGRKQSAKPYRQKKVPIDLIFGLILALIAVSLSISSLIAVADNGLLATFLYGVLLPLIVMSFAVACFRSWMSG